MNRELHKAALLSRGWTPELCRERMQGCREGLREARKMGGPSLFTYRMLYVSQYRDNKNRLAVLLSK